MRLKEKLGNYLTLKTHKSGGAFSSTTNGHALTIRSPSIALTHYALCVFAFSFHSHSSLTPAHLFPLLLFFSRQNIFLLMVGFDSLCFVFIYRIYYCFFSFSLSLILPRILCEFSLSHFRSFEFILYIATQESEKSFFSFYLS